MPQRLVVSFRGNIPPEPAGGERYLHRALGLKKRAEALGATLCAFGAHEIAFDLDPIELEEAVVLAMLALDVPTSEDRWSAGIAEGEMRAVGDAGSLAALAWGLPLVIAGALAREARPGEVLVDADLLVRREVEFTLLETVRLERTQRRLLPRADVTRTLSPPEPASAVLSTLRTSAGGVPPPLPPRARVALPPESMPGSVLYDGGRARRTPTVPPPTQASAPHSTHSGAIPPMPPPPVVIEAESLPLGGAASLRPEDPPPLDLTSTGPDTSRALPPEVAPFLRGALRRRPPSSPEIVAARPEPIVEVAKRALLQGDVRALERLLTQLRETGEHSELVERMTGLVALRRGATGEALRRLRQAAEAVREPAQQARARLAYGVALASAGRTEGALLEALEALARARSAKDLQGERACALFLARLSAAAGHQDAASAWAMVAARGGEAL
jgi:hypothetical protein